MKHHSDGQSDISGSLNMSDGSGDHVKEKKHLSSNSKDVLKVQGVGYLRYPSSRIAEFISLSNLHPHYIFLYICIFILLGFLSILHIAA